MAKLMFMHDYNPVTDVSTLWIFKPGETPDHNFVLYGVNINDVIIVKIDARTNELRGIEIIGACENKVNLSLAMHFIQQIHAENEAAKENIDWEEVFHKAIQGHEKELQFS